MAPYLLTEEQRAVFDDLTLKSVPATATLTRHIAEQMGVRLRSLSITWASVLCRRHDFEKYARNSLVRLRTFGFIANGPMQGRSVTWLRPPT